MQSRAVGAGPAAAGPMFGAAKIIKAPRGVASFPASVDCVDWERDRREITAVDMGQARL